MPPTTAAVHQAAPGPRRALAALCVTEITSWGVLYYAFPTMLDRLTRATGWSTAAAMSAFSTGLVVSALAGVAVGRLLERHGPRWVMTAGSAIGVVAVLAVATAPSLPWFFAAWVLVGLAQSALLYPPAVAALTRWYGPDRVRALTILSLVAGLASTVFAPLTAVLVTHLGWRAAFVVLAVLLGVVTIPLHAVCLRLPWPAATRHARGHADGHVRATSRSRAFGLLAAAMALAGFGMHAAIANLVPLLTSRGESTTVAAASLAVCGAGQVLGRLGYPTLTRRTSPRARTTAILAAGAVPIALLAVLPGPVSAVIVTATCVGAVRGTYTLLQATAVSDRWGTDQFATLNGIFVAPAIAATAIAPAGGALLADRLGSYPAAYHLLAILTLAGAALAVASSVPQAAIRHDATDNTEEEPMTDPQDLVDRYVAVWSEPDPGRRRSAIAELWSEDGVHVLQPPQEIRQAAAALGITANFEARGHNALEARVTRSYEEFVAPGEFTFRARDNAARLHDVVKFNWEMVPTGGGEPAGVGLEILEILVLDRDGRIRIDYQFIEA